MIKLFLNSKLVFIFLLLIGIIENGEALENKFFNENKDSMIFIVKPPPLPKIPYDEAEIQEVLDALPINSEIRASTVAYLRNIEHQVFEIQKYQSKKNPENFYEPMHTAVLDIRNTANALYELIKPYHVTLPNRIRELILDWVRPLEAELEKRLVMSSSDRNTLELKTKHLYAEQSFFSRQASLQQALIQHLIKLKRMLIESGRPGPRCYISYAWPSQENREQEYWVQPFLSILYDHLTAAGIRVIMDIRDNNPGDNIYQFMKRYHEGNYIILVGTESLLQKHYSIQAHAVQTELSIINDRFEQDQKQFGQSRIYPMLISGTLKTAYPEIYDKYRTVRDVRDFGYIGTLKKLIDWIYENRITQIQSQYTKLWQMFYESYPGLTKDLLIVEQEISLGCHHKRLEYLRQNLQYQSVEAQKESKLSQAVTAEMIGTLMKSQGNNPKTLFDETGQQFQRPQVNPDFIERKKLWEKMTQYFAQSDHQVLTLTTHGLGGVGKTELAQYYYQHPPRPYTIRAWFHASNRYQIYIQYVQFASENGFSLPKEIPIEQKITKIKSWLESQKDCLLIYDNVPDAKTVEGLLPERGEHHILMTSRNEVDWPIHQKLDVDVMEEYEAIALIRKITGNQENEEILKKLVKSLGYLPLALAQAGAYMSVKSLTVEEYLELYHQHQAKFLTDITVRSPKHEPVWITFNMNFEALMKESPATLMTLKQASWLDHAAIPEILLQLMVDGDEQQKTFTWADIKEYLKKYSLMHINVTQHQFSIHPLLQNILRDKQGTLEKLRTYSKVCESIDMEFNRKVQDLKDEVRKKDLLSHFQVLESHYKNIKGKRKDENDIILGKLLRDIGYIFYYLLGNSKTAESYYKRALPIIEQHYPDDKNSYEVATTLSDLGIIYRDLGNNEEARKLLENALPIIKKHRGEYHDDVAKILTYLGNTYRVLGNAKQAKKLLESAVMIQEKLHGNDYFTIARTLTYLGGTHRDLGEIENAKSLLERALVIKEKYYGKDHYEVANTLTYLGNMNISLGKFEDAEKLLERALAIKEKHYGKEHYETAITLTYLANASRQLGKVTYSKELLEQTLKAKEQHYGKEHYEVAITLTYLANAFRELGEIEEAKKLLSRALLIKEKHYGENHPEVALTLVSMGDTYIDSNQAEQARDLLIRALNILELHYSQKHLELAKALTSLGYAYIDLKEIEKAKELLQRALQIKQSCFLTADHPEIAKTLLGLARVFYQIDEINAGYPLSKKSYQIFLDNYGEKHRFTQEALSVFKEYQQTRKFTKNKDSLTSKNALLKLIYCACQKVLERWNQPFHDQALIVSQLEIYFEGKLNLIKNFNVDAVL